MYSNIPRDELLTVLKTKLTQSQKFIQEEIEDIVRITKNIINQSYFSYKDKIYYDPEGLPMGGPLSAILAEIYVRHFEEELIMSKTNSFFQKIKFYARYVDDTFMILKCSNRQTKLFLNQLNNLHPKIKFKMEMEKQSKLNFLDITVTKHTASKKHSIAI